MNTLQFIFIGEGASDSGLVPHLEKLCIELGADDVTGTAVDYQRLGSNVARTVDAKLRAVMILEPNVNLIFVHRDADSLDFTPRYEEIKKAIETNNSLQECVAVIPVQETEAWILLDESAIRSIAGRPTGRVPLNLPRPAQVESVTGPKERLREALIRASELTGRRRDRFQKQFSSHRQLLLERLPTGGPLLAVESWLRLKADLSAAINRTFADGGNARSAADTDLRLI